jgi:hypothetical protein
MPVTPASRSQPAAKQSAEFFPKVAGKPPGEIGLPCRDGSHRRFRLSQTRHSRCSFSPRTLTAGNAPMRPSSGYGAG